MPQLTPSEIILLRSMGEVIPDDGYLPSSSSEEVYDDEEVNITQRDLRNGNVVRTFRANGETMLRLLESEMQSSDNCSKQNVKDLLYGIADTAVDIAEKAESLAGGGGQPDGLGRLEEILAANVGDMNEEKLEQLILENLKEDQPKAGEPQAENTKEEEPKKQCGKCPTGGRRRSKRSRKKSKKKKR
jgi:hypothetical protein